MADDTSHHGSADDHSDETHGNNSDEKLENSSDSKHDDNSGSHADELQDELFRLTKFKGEDEHDQDLYRISSIKRLSSAWKGQRKKRKADESDTEVIPEQIFLGRGLFKLSKSKKSDDVYRLSRVGRDGISKGGEAGLDLGSDLVYKKTKRRDSVAIDIIADDDHIEELGKQFDFSWLTDEQRAKGLYRINRKEILAKLRRHEEEEMPDWGILSDEGIYRMNREEALRRGHQLYEAINARRNSLYRKEHDKALRKGSKLTRHMRRVEKRKRKAEKKRALKDQRSLLREFERKSIPKKGEEVTSADAAKGVDQMGRPKKMTIRKVIKTFTDEEGRDVTMYTELEIGEDEKTTPVKSTIKRATTEVSHTQGRDLKILTEEEIEEGELKLLPNKKMTRKVTQIVEYDDQGREITTINEEEVNEYIDKVFPEKTSRKTVIIKEVRRNSKGQDITILREDEYHEVNGEMVLLDQKMIKRVTKTVTLDKGGEKRVIVKEEDFDDNGEPLSHTVTKRIVRLARDEQGRLVTISTEEIVDEDAAKVLSEKKISTEKVVDEENEKVLPEKKKKEGEEVDKALSDKKKTDEGDGTDLSDEEKSEGEEGDESHRKVSFEMKVSEDDSKALSDEIMSEDDRKALSEMKLSEADSKALSEMKVSEADSKALSEMKVSKEEKVEADGKALSKKKSEEKKIDASKPLSRKKTIRRVTKSYTDDQGRHVTIYQEEVVNEDDDPEYPSMRIKKKVTTTTSLDDNGREVITIITEEEQESPGDLSPKVSITKKVIRTVIDDQGREVKVSTEEQLDEEDFKLLNKKKLMQKIEHKIINQDGEEVYETTEEEISLSSSELSSSEDEFNFDLGALKERGEEDLIPIDTTDNGKSFKKTKVKRRVRIMTLNDNGEETEISTEEEIFNYEFSDPSLNKQTRRVIRKSINDQGKEIEISSEEEISSEGEISSEEEIDDNLTNYQNKKQKRPDKETDLNQRGKQIEVSTDEEIDLAERDEQIKERRKERKDRLAKKKVKGRKPRTKSGIGHIKPYMKTIVDESGEELEVSTDEEFEEVRYYQHKMPEIRQKYRTEIESIKQERQKTRIAADSYEQIQPIHLDYSVKKKKKKLEDEAAEGRVSVTESEEEQVKPPTKPAPADGLDPETRGDEDEIVSEQTTTESQSLSEEEKIPDEFHYDSNHFQYKPRISVASGLPSDMVMLNHSYGYDCLKRANLHVLDEDTLLFAAGNVTQLLNFKTKEQNYIHSHSGGGIGAITVDPTRKYFAVAEKGSAPNINIFEYPSLLLYRILRGGTEKSYAFVDFSPDGKLLASVGGDPDFMLTLWDWKQEKTVLRSKAFSQDVFRVTFSTELEGQLTSSGTGHIRFWKMAKTFTGLKLQGQLGKFGKTEITDIEGYVELPDGKVLSGSEWGNMLLWDGGLIKVEISRKNKKPCHNGVIQQIVMDEGELMTVGADGYIRVWDFDTVDNADVTDQAPIFEMEPMNELKVGNGVSLRSIVKSADPQEPTMWYAQDGNGAIWKLDLSFSFTSHDPEKLMKYHAGAITGCAASPQSELVVTIGGDNFVIMYDYKAQIQLCRARYNTPGSAIIWAPTTVDPRGATVLAGFADGVVRVLIFQQKELVDVHGRKKENQSEFALKQAFKPHSGPVTCMRMHRDGTILATGSEDCTVFFFSINDIHEYEPIGFVNVPSTVTYMEWSPEASERKTLLVGCINGEIMEIASPEPGTFDTSHTFEITGLQIRTHVFKSVKSELRHQEELARIAKEEEERKKKEEEERKRKIERGEIIEGEEEIKKDEEEEEPEEEWEPYIPEEPSPVLQVFYGKDPDTFWVSMGGFDAGYFYKGKFRDEEEKAVIPEEELYEPIDHLAIEDHPETAITSMRFTKSKKFAVMGLADGSIRVQTMVEGEFHKDSMHWIMSSHDNDYGQVNFMEISFDNRFVFSVGADGNFFAYEFMDQKKIEEEMEKARVPSAHLKDKQFATDIDDPATYSIEDAKQKAEHDKMVKLAEEKKAAVRETIKTMRAKFKELIDMNKELPSHLQLKRMEFEMDPEIKKQLARQTEEKIVMVKKEMAWEEEKHRIALEKLKIRFKDMVECERIVVKAFQSEHEVCSFRASRLPDDFYRAKAELDNRKTTMMSKDDRQQTQDLTQGLGKEDSKEGLDKDQRRNVTVTTLKGSMGERINKQLQKVEEKKQKRAMRRAQWSDLYSSRPSDDYEDPADVAAIKDAKENMGDFKLKSAADYVVPDHLRMNTVKATSRLLNIKEQLHNHKYHFNQRLLRLRDKKIENIAKIKELRNELENVQYKLGAEHHMPMPELPLLYPEEIPERKYEYTRETLIKYREEIKAKEKKPSQAAPKDSFGGKKPTIEKSKAITPSPVKGLKYREEEEEVKKSLKLLIPFADEPVKTDLELRLEEAEKIRLLYRQERILLEIQTLLNNFDSELKCLRHEKFKLDVDLKNADLRHVTLFEEFLLLRDFEKHEDVLVAKLESKQAEKFEMQDKIVQVLAKIEAKKKEIEKLDEKQKALQATFQSSLGENNKFQDYLTKVFKKRIKRSKKKATEGDEDDDEDSEEESSDESDYDESDEESDSEVARYDLDVCPPGCDQNIYDNTCALREKRLDIEEALAEIKKDKDACNKEHESFTKKSKVIEGSVKQAENELEAFQLEKQQKLNELDVVVQLKLHQIQHTIHNALPSDLSQCLVFEQPGVIRLTHRIKELEQEKRAQKKQMREAKRQHVQLIKDRKHFDSRIEEMNDICNKMMVEKFGRIVDLEKLETVTVNRQVEELKEKLRLEEIKCSNDVLKWNEKIDLAKDKITELIRENTDKLDQLNMLLSEKKEFESELDSRHKRLGDEYGGVGKADINERQRLIQLVHLQAQEIDALKEEITLLSRKGGHILPPAQPPMPPSSQGNRGSVPPN